MEYEVEATDELTFWYENLSEDDQQHVNAAVDLLIQGGPALGRPIVGQVDGSKLHNLKELRPRGGHIRILFLFDPRRTAILLIGGDKTGQWHAWYAEMIPVAEALYLEYLDDLRLEGLID